MSVCPLVGRKSDTQRAELIIQSCSKIVGPHKRGSNLGDIQDMPTALCYTSRFTQTREFIQSHVACTHHALTVAYYTGRPGQMRGR